MTYTSIKTQTASNIGYVDGDGVILTGKAISETDFGNWVNNRYRDCMTAIIAQYPEDYEITARANFYKATGTVGNTSADTTIVATTEIFNNGMVGDTIYNATEDESAKIVRWTSTTQVTIDTDEDTDWRGDTIYVLGHEFAIGSSTLYEMRYVGVKYSSDDDFYPDEDEAYTKVEQRDQNKLFRTGSETYSEDAPVYYLTTSSISSVFTSTIGILPEPTRPVISGIFMRYIKLPADLSATTDVPRLPYLSHQVLVWGATADAKRKLQRFTEADSYEELYRRGKTDMIANYSLTRMDAPARVYPSSRLRRFLDRTQ